MSTVQPQSISPGTVLLQYRLVRQLGDAQSSVWLAEETRSGREVAVKILSRRLPADSAAADALLAEARQRAAIFHPAIPVILEVNASAETLFMVMEWIDGSRLSDLIRNHPLDRNRFFRVAYPVTDAVAYLHSRGIIHSAIAPECILVSRVGQIKLAGLGVRNILRRPSAVSPPLPRDLRAASFLAPEQVAGRPPDEKSDIFSLGAVFYEMLTGKAPFDGSTPEEIGSRIMSGQPASPKALNPSVDPAALIITGRCLFKDPAKRFAAVKLMLDDMKKAEPALARIEPPKAPAPQPAAPEPDVIRTRQGILFVADIPYYAALEKEDSERALRTATRMQQIVGEAVYLYDGKVSESLGSRMVGEMPSRRKATEAAAKAKADLEAWNASVGEQDRIEPRMVLHAGEIRTEEGKVKGPALDLALAALDAAQPLQIVISERLLDPAEIEKAGVPAGKLEGVRFYPPLPPPPPHFPDLSIDQNQEMPAAAEGEAARRAFSFRISRGWLVPSAVGAAILAVVVGAGLWWQNRAAGEKPEIGVRTVVAARPVERQQRPRTRVAIEEFTSSSADPAAAERANRIRLASMEILRSIRPIQVVNDSTAEIRIGGRVRDGASGPELVSIVGAAEEGTIPLRSSSLELETATFIGSILRQIGVPAERLVLPSERAFDSYAAALAAFESAGGKGNSQASSLIRASIASDTNFLPAQKLAMRLFAAEGNRKAAMDAGATVIDLDPEDTEALRDMAKWEIEGGQPVPAIAHFQQLLEHDPFDADGLEGIGLYSLSVGGDDAFRKVLVRFSGARPPRPRRLHEPDLLFYGGKIDQAVAAYYDLERADPSNPHLALKIGRIAVLRHSMEMAQHELGRLQKLDPDYGYHVLKAYIHAEKRQRRNAYAELQMAKAKAQWNDQPFTAAAEVAAIGNDVPAIITSLSAAVARGEATGNYILNNPLFGYLKNDRRYVRVRKELQQRMAEISDQLAKARV